MATGVEASRQLVLHAAALRNGGLPCLREASMRLIGNYYSEWADARGDTRRTLLVTLVACPVGAIASAAVIFSLVGSPTTQSSAPPILPRAIVRNVGAPEVPKTVQDGPMVEHRKRQCGTPGRYWPRRWLNGLILGGFWDLKGTRT